MQKFGPPVQFWLGNGHHCCVVRKQQKQKQGEGEVPAIRVTLGRLALQCPLSPSASFPCRPVVSQK